MNLKMVVIMASLVITSNIAIAEEYTASGKIKSFDHESKIISIKHDRISRIAMPTMPMVFQVPDTSVLNGVENGQNVNFTFTINRRGKYLLSAIQ